MNTGLEISKILDKYLPADGVGTEREKTRMEMALDISILVKNNVDLADVSQRNEQLALLRWMKNEPEFNIDDESEILDDYEYYKTNCG